MTVRRWLLGVALVVVAIILGSCKSGADRLETLRTDPMARVDLPGAIDRTITETPGNASLGVTSPAKIRNTFTVPAGGVPAGIETLAEDARAAGWDLRDRAAGGYEGDKIIDDLFAQVLITGLANDNVLWVEISTNDS